MKTGRYTPHLEVHEIHRIAFLSEIAARLPLRP